MLTMARYIVVSGRLLEDVKLVMKHSIVGTDRSNARTFRIRCSIRNTCLFVYVSSVMYTNSPTSGGYISSYFLKSLRS
jgi:hypothetical protein